MPEPVRITLTSTTDQALARLAQVAPVRIARALNRASTSARVVVAQAIAKDMGIGASVIRERIRIRQARPENLVTSLGASPKRIPLMDFAARQTTHGVTYRGKNGRQKLPHAFLATMGSGHTGVFERRGKPRLPIAEKFGPSIWLVFTRYADVGRARGEAQLKKNLQSEFRFASLQAGGE